MDTLTEKLVAHKLQNRCITITPEAALPDDVLSGLLSKGIVTHTSGSGLVTVSKEFSVYTKGLPLVIYEIGSQVAFNDIVYTIISYQSFAINKGIL